MVRGTVTGKLVVAMLVLASCAFAEGGGHGDFIYASGTNLMLRGKPFRYVGANTYYLMTYAAEAELRKYVDEVFDEARRMGIKVIRTWAFNNGSARWNALQTSPGSYSEQTFVGLDYVIAKAKKSGVYLILCLGNNWEHYGGARQYLDWCPEKGAKEHNAFFTDIHARQYYKDHIKRVLERRNTITKIKYKDDPTILAWELMNEPRAEGDFSGDILNGWIGEMSAYVKSIDKNHLVTTGCEGFYADKDESDWKFNGAMGSDFIRNHSIETVDIASFHLWPSSVKYVMSEDDVRKWIEVHADDAKKINKPVILGEFGEYCEGREDTLRRDRLFKLVLDLAEKNKIAGSNFWTLMHDDYRRHDDGCGVFYPEHKRTIEIIKSAASSTDL
jgi:mannan endo-1,4-beta-mannosidase